MTTHKLSHGFSRFQHRNRRGKCSTSTDRRHQEKQEARGLQEPMTIKTPAQRQSEYYLRKIEAGFKQVGVWVKADKVKAVKDFVKSLKP